jgi:hypothetical protein
MAVRFGSELIEPPLAAGKDLVVSGRGIGRDRLRPFAKLSQALLDARAELLQLDLGRRGGRGIHGISFLVGR